MCHAQLVLPSCKVWHLSHLQYSERIATLKVFATYRHSDGWPAYHWSLHIVIYSYFSCLVWPYTRTLMKSTVHEQQMYIFCRIKVVKLQKPMCDTCPLCLMNWIQLSMFMEIWIYFIQRITDTFQFKQFISRYISIIQMLD